MTHLQRAVFLDRDGTLNQEIGYIRTVEDLVLIPGAAQAIAQLNQAGILAILTTNQSGIERGFYGHEHVAALHQRLALLLKAEGDAHLDAVFYSPYRHTAPCRKPNTGMIEQAVAQFPSIQLQHSFVVGDKASDIEFAHQAGCKGVLLKTGYGQRVLEGKYQSLTHQPWQICESIVQAVQVILAESAYND